MTAFVQHKNNFVSGGNTNRLHSPNVWADCPIEAIQSGYNQGSYFFDDFLDFNLPQTQTSAVAQGKYVAYCAASGQWIADNMPHSTTAGTGHGWISGLCDTDNDSMAIGTTSCPILLTTTQTGKAWFEARIATTSILTAMGQLFCGWCENRVAAFSSTVPLAGGGGTTGANTTNAMIGFRRDEDGLSVLDTLYADHSATYGTVALAASTGVLAADTAIKLAIKVDMADTLRCVRFYVNGLECATAMTKAALLATTYLDAAALGPCLAFYADTSGTADYVYLDWWASASTLA